MQKSFVIFSLSLLLFLFLSNRVKSRSSEHGRESVKATWYESGHTTANGERFNPNKLTCATWDYPFNTVLNVTYNNKTIQVRVNDRGPRKDIYAKGVKIDLSRAAFSRLEKLEKGKITVSITVHTYANDSRN